MASFVDELSESSLKSKLSNALNRPKPFGNFSRIIHSCILREKWFEYKYKMLERRAVEIINEINIINNWK